nr:retrotransposon protein, putative, Ty1-copia subclass [Tanacetum cinerariifolium]
MCNGKSKKKSHKPKSKDTNQEKLYLLHMNLYGPMRVESVNGKKYILVIVDDYSRFTWVKYLRSKDEALNFIIKFLKMIQVRHKVPVHRIQTDNRADFVNQTLRKYYEQADIGFFIVYAPTKKAFRIYNRRTRRIIETIHVDFDELTAMTSEKISSRPALHEMTPATISSGLLTTPSPSKSQTTPETQPPVSPHDVEEDNHDIEVAHMGNDPLFVNSLDQFPQDRNYMSKLFTATDAFLTSMEPKAYKDALTQSCWIEAMQEELNEFKQLEVWELIP